MYRYDMPKVSFSNGTLYANTIVRTQANIDVPAADIPFSVMAWEISPETDSIFTNHQKLRCLGYRLQDHEKGVVRS